MEGNGNCLNYSMNAAPGDRIIDRLPPGNGETYRETHDMTFITTRFGRTSYRYRPRLMNLPLVEAPACTLFEKR